MELNRISDMHLNAFQGDLGHEVANYSLKSKSNLRSDCLFGFFFLPMSYKEFFVFWGFFGFFYIFKGLGEKYVTDTVCDPQRLK